jgi:hypothetical protein
MAQECRGDVYVMTDEPTRLATYGNIWGNVEHPTLRNQRQAADILYVVDAASKLKYTVNWDTLAITGGPVRMSFEDAINATVPFESSLNATGHNALTKREDECDIDRYEPAGIDFFG